MSPVTLIPRRYIYLIVHPVAFIIIVAAGFVKGG